MENKKDHWENIYSSKQLNEVSWYQPTPSTSISFFNEFKIPKTAKIIDVGGGDSFLVDNLLDMGYQNITVLDISQTALDRAKLRLGKLATKVKWIVADAANFVTTEKYDFWHDRAAFHFLTEETEIVNYVSTIQKSINPEGVLVLGTFSENGPKKCSGIEIKQYTEKSMIEKLEAFFKKIKCLSIDHITPFNTVQNFIFCSFKRLNHAV